MSQTLWGSILLLKYVPKRRRRHCVYPVYARISHEERVCAIGRVEEADGLLLRVAVVDLE